jgi:hypothetical protein
MWMIEGVGLILGGEYVWGIGRDVCLNGGMELLVHERLCWD